MNIPYERNEYVINHQMNVCFEDLLEMDETRFRQWVGEMRNALAHSWDTYGCPPRTGKSVSDIIENWNKLETYPVYEFEFDDELSDVPKDVIINKSRGGSEVDQFFENMFRTRINYTDKDTGYSIYDLVADPNRFEQVYKGSLRHFRRDSFYNYALSTIKNNAKYSIVSVDSGEKWIDAFFTQPEIFKGRDFLLEQVKFRDGTNTGYFQLEQSDILQLTKDQVQKYKDCGWLQYRHHSTFDIENMPDDRIYSIRLYEKGKKLFPACFKAFRIGYIQPAVNFPPMTAKYLYERFTEHVKSKETLYIYDPSAGWGGRILGAMSMRDDRRAHYLGTDPNPDNYFSDGTSKYSMVADFYNQRTTRSNTFFSDTNEYTVYQLGSEEVHKNEDVQKYEGKIDLIFTSPPYFNREAYSEDENQSYKKYGSTYESWRDGFLRPTLETCAKWLAPGRYLLWNIADILIKGEYLPLEEDSRKILEEMGLEYKYKLKMALEGMPGQNRVDENGIPLCKNYCKVNGKHLKYEPIYVFWKPE
jgi:hypothetical protein